MIELLSTKRKKQKITQNMDRGQFVNGNEIVDYWGYLNSVSVLCMFLHLFSFVPFTQIRIKICIEF